MAENLLAWQRWQVALHRLIYTLQRLGLPLANRVDDPAHGLVFDVLADPEGGPKVLTGHDEGVITLALSEADDAERERRRTAMGEPYRTLLGHVRHETGHHYWDLLVRDAGRLEECRAVFGDDSQDYNAALQAHYANGAPAGLAVRLRQRLCDRPSLGGFRRDLGALPAHHRHAGNGRGLRAEGAPDPAPIPIRWGRRSPPRC